MLKDMAFKTVLFTAFSQQGYLSIYRDYIGSESEPGLIQRISAQLPMLILVDLLYAYFLGNWSRKQRKSLIAIGKTKIEWLS